MAGRALSPEQIEAVRKINSSVVLPDGLYERKNIEYTIQKTWNLGFQLYPNEKTESWLQSNGLQLPAHLASFLNGSYKSVSKDACVPVDLSICQNRENIKTRDGDPHAEGVSLSNEVKDCQQAKDALDNGPRPGQQIDKEADR